jgi:hypothetical protein
MAKNHQKVTPLTLKNPLLIDFKPRITKLSNQTPVANQRPRTYSKANYIKETLSSQARP